MKKLKEGRPKKSDGIFFKYKKVYEAIPNSEPIRFYTLSEKLKPMSRSTISKALEYGVFTGLLKKDHKSSKDITYSKTSKIITQSLDNIEQQLKILENLGYDVVQKRLYFLNNIQVPYRRDFLLQIKKENQIEDLIHTQAIFINLTFGVIELFIQKALNEYAHKTNMPEAKKWLYDYVHSIIIPQIMELTDYIDDVGLNDKVIQALWLCNRRALQESDFANDPAKHADFQIFQELDFAEDPLMTKLLKRK